jgi:hypothetical protein
MNRLELKVARRQTTHFIAQNPIDVTITRGGQREPDGAGGYKVTPGPAVETQKMRKVIQSKSMASRNIDGEEISPEFVFIGEWDADIKKGDVIVISSRNYEVVFVRDDPPYETWAEVVYRG